METLQRSQWHTLPDGFNPDEPLYVLTDIHSCTEALTRLLSEKPSDARLVFLGDAVDRGPDPLGTLRLIMSDSSAILLHGNHDAMAWYAQKEITLDSPRRKSLMENSWESNGGRRTMSLFIRAIREGEPCGTLAKEVPSLFEQYWLQGKDYWLSGNILFVHAGYPAKKSDDWLTMDTEKAACTEDSPIWWRGYSRKDLYTSPSTFAGKKVFVISGHTPLDEKYTMRPYGITLDKGYGRKMAAELRPGEGCGKVRFFATDCTEISGSHATWNFFPDDDKDAEQSDPDGSPIWE
ncbi:MAG: metallophosphoesterase [Desulfovibrionaceae bacterium]|nr:metallophosphoesterase [Desulfovibrionaceae bacterium]